MCLKSWLTRLTYGLLQNLDMYMSLNVVDLVDFDFHSPRRLKILNICVSKKLVDKVVLGLGPKSRYVLVAKCG